MTNIFVDNESFIIFKFVTSSDIKSLKHSRPLHNKDAHSLIKFHKIQTLTTGIIDNRTFKKYTNKEIIVICNGVPDGTSPNTYWRRRMLKEPLSRSCF